MLVATIATGAGGLALVVFGHQLHVEAVSCIGETIIVAVVIYAGMRAIVIEYGILLEIYRR